MKKQPATIAFRAVVVIAVLASEAKFASAIGVLYSDPGWTYAYDGNEAYYNDPDGPNPNYTRDSGPDDFNQPGGKSETAALVFPGFTSPGVVDDAHAKWLNVSSQWDGSAPGAPLGGIAGSPPPIPPAAPGGVGTFNDGSTSFLRLQDTGDPTSWGWADKGAQGAPGLPRQEGSNRKIEFAHPLSRDAGYSGNQTLLDSGVTLTFRTRIATAATGPIDGIYSQDGPGSSSVLPWPTNGVGYPIANGGRAAFDISDSGGSSGRQIGFGLVNDATIAQSSHAVAGKTGLVINNSAVGPAGGSVDTFDATASTLNIVDATSNQLTQWQEFWITIKKLPTEVTAATGNTHEVDVYYNGSTTPQIFQVVASTPNQDGGNGPALGLGLSSGTLWGGFDVDFFAYKEGIFAPTSPSGLLGDYNHDGVVNAADYIVWRNTLGSTTDLSADGNGDHSVNQADYSVWRTHFGATGSGLGSGISVPEPSSLAISLLGIVAVGLFSTRSSRTKSHIFPFQARRALAAASVAAVFGGGALVVPTLADEAQPTTDAPAPQTIEVGQRHDIQKILDDAPDHSIIVFNRNSQLALSEPLQVTKPLTIRGLNAKLPPNVGDSPLVSVKANGVTIEDFQLYGNNDTVPQEKREALIFITGNDFRVEHGIVENSSRHGVYAEPRRKADDLVGGVIRDIVGRGNARCVVGVGNNGNEGPKTKNIVIENIRCYNSSLRGAVNVKDGTDNIVVRDIYSENSVYAVDVQDHQKAGEINRNITVENIHAVKCKYAVRSNNRPIGHENLTIRNVIAEHCAMPIRIAHVDRLTLENIRVLDHHIGEEPFPPIRIEECNGVFLRDILLSGSDYAGPGVDIVNSNDVAVDGFTLQGVKGSLTSGIRYHLGGEGRYSGLRISNASATQLGGNGILLDSDGDKATLSNYVINGNVAEVSDHIHGQGSSINQNAAASSPLSNN